MKAIPILLSTLTLATSGAGSAVPLAMQTASERPVATVASTGYEDILLGTNQFSPYVEISMINFDREVVGFMMNEPRANWHVKRVMVVRRDFEEGISEAKADAKLPTLGVEDEASWAVKMLDRQVSTPTSLGLMYNAGMTKKTLVNNLSDQFYFAVQFGEYKTNESGARVWGTETQWVRGKVDYRSCIHSTMFEKPTTTMCALVKDGERYKAIPRRISDWVDLTPPADEKVLTWEEEWRAIQLERVQGAIDQLAEVWEKLQLVTKRVEDGTKIANKADVAYTEVGDDDGNQFSKKIVTLNELIKNITGMYAGLQGEQLLAEKQALTEKVEQLTTEKGQLEQEKLNLESEQTRLQQEKVELEGEQELLLDYQRVLEQGKVELETEKAALVQENQILQQEIVALKQELARVTRPNEEDKTPGKLDDAAPTPVEKPETTPKTDAAQDSDGGATEGQKKPSETPRTSAISIKVTEGAEATSAEREEDESSREGTTATPVARVELAQTAADAKEVGIPDLGGSKVEKAKQWWWPLVAVAVSLTGALGVLVAKLKRR